MLRIFERKNADELVAYHQDDLDDSEISPGRTTTATWIGHAAVRLGLTGPVQDTAFRRLCRNQDPRTGRRLTQRNARKRRVAHDCVLSAPKSVSVMALVVDDTRVTEAHREAATETMVEVEKVAKVRVRRRGANADRVTGNIVGASFEHYLSREDDPQLHTHNDVFNLTCDPVEATWKALQPVEFYARSGFFTAFYRSRLAAKLHLLGYETRRGPRSLEIKGVSKEVIGVFSKRHAEIDRREAAMGVSGNVKLRAGIAHRCRRPKDTSAGDLDELRCAWKAQLSAEQLSQLESVKAAAVKPCRPKRVTAARAIRIAAEHLFERRSSVCAHELLAEALMVSAGQHTLPRLEQALAADKRLHRHGEYVFSAKETTTMVNLFSFVQDGIGQAPPLAAACAPSSNLDHEQQQTLQSLLACRDQVMELRGSAGTGKTRLLQELARQLIFTGKPLIMLAPTTAAVRVLKENQFDEAMTLQRFFRVEPENLAKDGVIVLDEAGQASTVQMHALFGRASSLSARVILVGDIRQHGSVQAGDALRFLEQRTQLHHADLTTIRRQTSAPYRQAVERMRDGSWSEGFRALDKLGWVHEIVDDEQRYAQVAKHFEDCLRSHKSALVVCSTWREVSLVNERIRHGLKAAGLLALEDQAVESLTPLNFTVAQRQQLYSYEPGQVIVFREKRDRFVPRQRLTVVAVEDQRLLVRTACGKVVPLFPPNYAEHFSVFASQLIELAAGDQVLILENYYVEDQDGPTLSNGDLATVASIERSGAIVLTDGRMVPASFRHFTHGYAITSQRAQSQTVDEVLLAIDAQSAFCAAKAETLYVAASRGREHCMIFTDDKELLLEAVSRSGERLNAVDLISRKIH